MNDKAPKLYRKRYIPDECVCLGEDEITYFDDALIVTRWRTLKPRLDFNHGCSCYYLGEGIKISRFYDKTGRLLYHYCDIIEPRYDAATRTYVFHDLLADVMIYDNGFIKVLDLDEIAIAAETGVITPCQASCALKTLDKLLRELYTDGLRRLAAPLDSVLLK